MLVLSRKENESIIIDDEVEIKIVYIRPDQVKIGIVAPKHVRIFRKEIFDEITRENQEAKGVRSLENLKGMIIKKKD